MIIGSGMLASAFERFVDSTEILVYAAGVSNSLCENPQEFERDSTRLKNALFKYSDVEFFIYFGTCSIFDACAQNSPYVKHKLAMESLVAEHPSHLIIRLPQVAGRTSNPHTLLNYLYSKIVHNEEFSIYKNASRNIIDVDDIVKITVFLLENAYLPSSRLNMASPLSCSVLEIVSAMEKATETTALADIINGGSYYEIDTSEISSITEQAGVSFNSGYLERVIKKYYSRRP